MSTLGVFACIFDGAERILLVRHATGRRQWSTPGGRVDSGESPVAALARELREEIACDTSITHLIGVYAKPYRDDLVLSFAARVVTGIPEAQPPEISELAFFSRASLPHELAFNTRVRIDDAYEQRRGILRVFDTAATLASSFDAHADSHGRA